MPEIIKMSSELPQTPDFTIQEERLQYGAEKKKQRDTARLIWGDKLLVMQVLLAQGYEGQINLIYIDPPFNTGENFNFPNEVAIGDKTFEKEMPMSERLAYTYTWDRGSLLSLIERCESNLALLKMKRE